jgi:hypothetical protein
MKASVARDPPSEEISEAEAFAPTWSRKDDRWSSPSWKRAAADYHADRKRGAPEPPLSGNGFWEKCAEADRRAARRKPQHDLPANWETMSVGALWHTLNDPRRRADAAQSTYDALLYELRTYGIAQLAKPNCRDRLSSLSTRQLRELIAALMRLKPKYPAINDELLLKLGEQL